MIITIKMRVGIVTPLLKANPVPPNTSQYKQPHIIAQLALELYLKLYEN